MLFKTVFALIFATHLVSQTSSAQSPDIASAVIGMSAQDAESAILSNGFNKRATEYTLNYEQRLAKGIASNHGREWYENPRGMLYVDYIKGKESIRVIFQQTRQGPIVERLWYSIGANADSSVDIGAIANKAKLKYGQPSLIKRNSVSWCRTTADMCNLSAGQAVVMEGNTHGGVDINIYSSLGDRKVGENQLRDDLNSAGVSTSF